MKNKVSEKLMDLTEDTSNAGILSKLKIVTGPNGKIKSGPLLTNRHANIFHVKGSDNRVHSLICYWAPENLQWVVVVEDYDYEWGDGGRVFCRNKK